MSTIVEEVKTPLVTLTPEDIGRARAIADRIVGWSGDLHYAFFKHILEHVPPLTRILMLGVYHGRDIAYIVDILKNYHPGRVIEVVGVDRFSADPCADWAQSKELRTWEQETRGFPPPSFEKATANTADPRVRIIKSDDFNFLDTTEERFDAIYYDTAHDFNTVVRQLRQTPRVCLGDALLCGDDYSDQYTWGVKSAVEKRFTEHTVFGGWIWASSLSMLRTQ